MTFALARVPLLRLLRTRRAWLPVAAWTAIAVASALVARARGGSGADQVLRGTFGYVVLPLVSYALVSAALGGAGLRRGIEGVVALGAEPKRAALASAVVAAAASALAGGLLAALVCALAHGPSDAPLARDLPASTWIGALGGAAYAAYFSAGSAIGRGAMRGVFLLADFLLGAGAGVGALFTPRGHVRALLGGPLCAELPQRASSALLVGLVFAWGALAVTLARRR